LVFISNVQNPVNRIKFLRRNNHENKIYHINNNSPDNRGVLSCPAFY
jgi:hypothetical protein